MKSVFEFLIKINELKNVTRKGITFYGVKNPPNALDHTYRTAMMVWFLGKEKRLNVEKAIKMALIHDVCKIYAGDITPYNGLSFKSIKKRYKFFREWPPRASSAVKRKKYIEKIKKEKKALEKLTKKLPDKLKKEVLALWQDYEKGNSKEARFVYQLDRTENLLEAFECYKKDKKFPTRPWWQHAEEVIDDPVLLKFLEEIEEEELKTK